MDNEASQTKLLDLVDQIDETLIALLLANTAIRETFFAKIKDVYVFKTNDFKFFMEENKLDNSYTKYKNRIGLTDGKNFLKETNDVVLNFPYKDCILAGGQTTEDGMDSYFEYEAKKTKTVNGEKIIEPAGFKEKQAKRKEVFFNQILAKDEIDRLLDDKAFVNWKRFTSNGEAAVKAIKRAADGTIKENLIIKGNNLLALHSLKKQFTGKIKLIYIDPPYNTGSDSFKYNDNFNHSTWLTFMKNRLEVAKNLLSEDGVILVQCSFHQFAYLKVLMNDIFVKHLCDLNIQVRHPDRNLTGDKEFNDVIEYILIYANNANKKMPFQEKQKTIDEYTKQIKIKANIIPDLLQCGNKLVEVYKPNQYKVISIPADKSGLKKISIRGSIREKNSSGRFFVKYLESNTDYPAETLFKVPNMGDDLINYRYFYSAPMGKKNGGYYQGMPTSSTVTKKQYSNFYNFEKEYNSVAKQGSVEFRNGKKPEELIRFLINLFTSKQEIVLDYHLGSGTTAAVAHKMGRQYIGIEQMNYIDTVAIKRIENVIGKIKIKDLLKQNICDKTGISKSVKWEGGGDFIYCELAKWNETAKEKINECMNLSELKFLFSELYEKYFLNYNVKVKEFKDKIINEANFKALSLIEQKRMFLVMLDLNQMYVQKTEMADKQFGISRADQALTAEFYNEGI